VPGAGLEPALTLLSTGFSYQLQLSLPFIGIKVCGLDFLSTLFIILIINLGHSRKVSALFAKQSLQLSSGLSSALPVKISLNLRVYAKINFSISAQNPTFYMKPL